MNPYYQDSAVTIYHGDCREVALSIDDVDLILTDPPYGRDSLNSWKSLGDVGYYCLKQGSWCLAYSGHGYWPEILSAVTSGGLQYRWTIALRHSGNSDLRPIAEMLIEIGWKPIFIFSKPPVRLPMGSFRFNDFLNGSGRSKSNHPWEQSQGELTYLIERFDSGVILDPFMGSGTTLRAAKDLGRKAIGIEIEERYCEIAARRMEQEVFDFSRNGSSVPAVEQGLLLSTLPEQKA
jgi:site-specific DNA-methyltransferase (adenine-specific)